MNHNEKPKTIKIGIVFDDSLDRDDGVQQYIKTLGSWLIKRGHDVRFLVGQTENAGKLQSRVISLAKNIKVKANMNVLTIPLPVKKNMVAKILIREKFDILHVQMPYHPFWGGKIISLADCPIIATFHAFGSTKTSRFGTKILRVFQRKTVTKIDRYISVSKAAETFAKNYFKINSEIVPCPVDISHFKYPDKQKQRPKRIVFLGRLVPRKGALTLLKAINYFESDYQVCIGGKGPLMDNLKRYVNNHGLKNVEFEGYIQETEKVNFLANSDFAIFPASGGESFGIILVEAMATQGPIVLAGNNEGYSTVMQSAQLFPAADPVALAQKINDISTDSPLRQSLSLWQQQRVKDFDIANIGEKIESIYFEVLDKNLKRSHT